jgi:hypothetical protein
MRNFGVKITHTLLYGNSFHVKTKFTLHRLVGLPGGRMSTSSLSHLPDALLGGGGMVPRKLWTASATELCRRALKNIK